MARRVDLGLSADSWRLFFVKLCADWVDPCQRSARTRWQGRGNSGIGSWFHLRVLR